MSPRSAPAGSSRSRAFRERARPWRCTFRWYRSDGPEWSSLAGRVHALPLLQERAHCLTAVLGEGALRHRLGGAGVRGVEVEVQGLVEHLLAEGLRGAAAAAGGECEALGLRLEAIARHDAVDQAPVERGARIDRVAGERELERALAAYAAGDRDHGGVAEPTAAPARRREPGLLRSHGQVGGGDQLTPG